MRRCDGVVIGRPQHPDHNAGNIVELKGGNCWGQLICTRDGWTWKIMSQPSKKKNPANIKAKMPITEKWKISSVETQVTLFKSSSNEAEITDCRNDRLSRRTLTWGDLQLLKTAEKSAQFKPESLWMWEKACGKKSGNVAADMSWIAAGKWQDTSAVILDATL